MTTAPVRRYDDWLDFVQQARTAAESKGPRDGSLEEFERESMAKKYHWQVKRDGSLAEVASRRVLATSIIRYGGFLFDEARFSWKSGWDCVIRQKPVRAFSLYKGAWSIRVSGSSELDASVREIGLFHKNLEMFTSSRLPEYRLSWEARKSKAMLVVRRWNKVEVCNMSFDVRTNRILVEEGEFNDASHAIAFYSFGWAINIVGLARWQAA